MVIMRKLPESVPFNGPKERPIGPYLAFMVLEFWLFVGGVALLFFWPVWGAVVIALAVVLFIIAALVGG